MLLKRIRLLRWSLRKLSLPIKFNDLVVEVGSGGNPHPASSVLAEKFIDSSHRLRAIKIDREIVLADACNMPFIDKAFDYSIAFHVLEHVPDPSAFIAEMSRISTAGYIETPNALYERLYPLDVHILEVAEASDELVIYKKPQAIHDPILAEASLPTHDHRWAAIFASRPELFHVCHKWKDRIKFRVLNNDQSLDWHIFPEAGLEGGGDTKALLDERKETFSFRQMIISTIRRFYLLMSNRKFDIEDILACPQCKGKLSKNESTYQCTACMVSYKASPIRDFTKPYRI